ncbi:MAG: carboxypeptidase-like regulatory domain-containing protein [Planctomycetes bacterium]|nr:carboxypeptidase-like regulatory domain-containing protein [Planctomycetota bacterium]
MEREEAESGEEPARAEPTKLTRKDLIGVLILGMFITLANTGDDAEAPAWARELPTRIAPPLETPTSPLGGANITGVVLSSAGFPVRDALVSSGSGELLAWDYSDKDGRFTLSGLPDGAVSLRVIGDDHHPEEFTVSSGEASVELKLSEPFQEAPSLPAIVELDVTAEVSSPRSRWGVEGYELWLEPLSPAHELGAPVSRRAPVGANRSITLDGLIAGRYRAALLPPWAQAGTWPNLLDPETPIFTIGLSEVDHLELKMVAGEIEGTVIDDSGKLVAKAIVAIHPEGRPDQVWPQAHTDERGHFALRDLPVGSYILSAYAGDLSVELPIQMPGPSTLKVDLSLRR